MKRKSITALEVRFAVRDLAKKIDRLYQRVVDADKVFGSEWRATELLSSAAKAAEELVGV